MAKIRQTTNSVIRDRVFTVAYLNSTRQNTKSSNHLRSHAMRFITCIDLGYLFIIIDLIIIMIDFFIPIFHMVSSCFGIISYVGSYIDHQPHFPHFPLLSGQF